MHLHDESIYVLKELGRRNIEIIADRTGKTTSDIEKKMKDVKLLTAEQAKTFGIVTKIIDKLPFGPNLNPKPNPLR